jgi:acetyl esterase
MTSPIVRFLLLVLLALFIIPASYVAAQGRTYPPEIEGTDVYTYKQVDDVELKLWVFQPDRSEGEDLEQLPAIVFFFGGGWNGGSPNQFVPQCQHLAQRGMVAAVADYRVKSRHDVQAVSCVRDAKSCVRWIRSNAEMLGIDSERVAAGGGSAGGHLAAAVGLIEAFDEEDEDLTISSQPNAMVLCNPAVVLAPVEGQKAVSEERLASLGQRMGVESEQLSPYHHVRENLPPSIIFHGKGDTTVPYLTVEIFEKAMTEAGNDCELVGYEGRPHGFFNSGRNNNEDYDAVLKEMDRFLTELGYLEEE